VYEINKGVQKVICSSVIYLSILI